MALLDIEDLKGRRPNTLSWGERQRVALAQALAGEPRVLLLEEPFSALDVVTKAGLVEELMELKSLLNIPMVMVTHDLGEASVLADKVVAMERGRLVSGWIGLDREKSAGPVMTVV